MKKYAQIDNFTILAVTEADKVVGFTVGDRNRDRVTDKNFDKASDAIEFANEYFKNHPFISGFEVEA